MNKRRISLLPSDAIDKLIADLSAERYRRFAKVRNPREYYMNDLQNFQKEYYEVIRLSTDVRDISNKTDGIIVAELMHKFGVTRTRVDQILKKLLNKDLICRNKEYGRWIYRIKT